MITDPKPPELFKKTRGKLLKTKRKPRIVPVSPMSIRGGAFGLRAVQEFLKNVSSDITRNVIAIIAKEGGRLAFGLTSSGLYLFNILKLPNHEKRKLLLQASALTHLDAKTEMTRYSVIEGEKQLLCIDLNHISENSMEYLCTLLTDKTLPYHLKAKKAREIFTKHIDLHTTEGRLNLVLFLLAIISLFLKMNNMAGYYIRIKNILQAIKDGTMSKAMVRLLIRKMKEAELIVEPELIESQNQFKEYFLIWKSTHQFEVKVQILQLLAKAKPKKEFDVEKFLAPFDCLSNSKKTKIKKLFIEGIKEAIENRFVKLKFQMIQKDGSVKNTNQLMLINLTKRKYIYFYENVDYKSFLKNF